MKSQRIRHNLVTEQQQIFFYFLFASVIFSLFKSELFSLHVFVVLTAFFPPLFPEVGS